MKQSLNIPPSSIEIEESILSTLLNGYDILHKIPFITEDMFYLEKHRIIFNTIESLYRKNIIADILIVSNELKKLDKLEEIGGSYFIMELSNKLCHEANIIFNARIIQQDYIKRLLIQNASEISIKAYSPTTDALELLDEAITKNDDIVERNFFKNQEDNIISLVNEIKDDIKRAEKGEVVGISTGLADIDNYFTFEKGMIYVLAGRPGSGKSSVSLSLFTRNILEKNEGVMYSALEMPNKQVVRWLASSNGLEQRIVKYGIFNTNEEREKYDSVMNTISKYPIYFTSSNIFSEVISSAKLIMKNNKIKLWVIDYLQQLSIPKMGGSNRNSEIDLMMQELKYFAKKYDIPILVLSQLNREVEKRADKMPQLSDLRDSGTIEQAADVVLFIHRAAYYSEEFTYTIKGVDVPCSGIIKLIVAKNKDGVTGDVYIRHSQDLKNFYPYVQNIDVFDISPNSNFEYNTYESRISQKDVF